jgi:plastocyanin
LLGLAAMAAAFTVTLVVASAHPVAHARRAPLPPGAGQAVSGTTSKDGVEHLVYRYGPIAIAPGTNLIKVGASQLPHPTIDGYLVGLAPNLVLPDGSVPSVSILHLHHSVWLSSAAPDATMNLGLERFFASGEEKTQLHLPSPYGYRINAGDTWLLNYMIHNLTPRAYTVYITYKLDFVPASSQLGKRMRAVQPVWMDVENGHNYPVFNVLRGSGTNGTFTFPTQATDPYGSGPALNTWTVPRDGTIVWTGGHLHPGGLHDDLYLTRPGVGTVRIFSSQAHYWDPRGPISWDMAMGVTRPDFRVAIRAGDILSVSTTYETKRASWYESMGIMVSAIAWGDTTGKNPFTQHTDTRGILTHGRLSENIDHGGIMTMPMANPADLPSGSAPNDTVEIKNYDYYPGGLDLLGAQGDPPAIPEGQSLTYENLDNAQLVFHTVTDCAAPCNRNYGISYPLANGPQVFDSGQLGTGQPGFTASVNSTTWKTPADLPPGTYTFFCRVHPWMRGAFRVTG